MTVITKAKIYNIRELTDKWNSKRYRLMEDNMITPILEILEPTQKSEILNIEFPGSKKFTELLIDFVNQHNLTK